MISMEALQQLKDENIELYRVEIVKEWDTQEEDIAMLETLIDEYGGREPDGKIAFTTAFHTSSSGVDVEFPGWLIGAVSHFTKVYGEDKGQVVLEKCLHQLWEQMVPAQPVAVSK